MYSGIAFAVLLSRKNNEVFIYLLSIAVGHFKLSRKGRLGFETGSQSLTLLE